MYKISSASKGNNSLSDRPSCTQIARFMGPTWGPTGDDRTQVGPMLAPWTLLSRYGNFAKIIISACCLNYKMNKSVTPFDIEMSPHHYEKSHCGDMTTIFTHNVHSYTCKMASLYWSLSLISQSHDTGLYHSYHKRQHDSQLALWASKARGTAVPCQGTHAPMPLYQFSIDYSKHH